MRSQYSAAVRWGRCRVASAATPARRAASRGEGPAAAEPRSGRLTVGDLRRDRLDQLHRRDPALDALVDALDLELIDDD